jgi:hypothetical protein
MRIEVVEKERRWWTYLKAVLFLIPPLGVWAILEIFCIPKLKEICADAGVFPGQALFRSSDFVMQNWLIIAAVFLILIAGLEFNSAIWRKYRRGILGTFVFFLNSAAVVSIAGMLIIAIMVAPALLHK